MRLLRRGGRLLSVVVPAYQVEDYLGDCLDSVLAQSHRELEVLVVDDGSTDRTGEIADGYAHRDRRVRVVHQDNAGLGAARNVGVQHATGDLLAFVDSDDLLVAGAYARMVRSLEMSGSDLVVGAVERLDGARRFMTPLMRENHRAPAAGVRLEQRPLMLADVFAWNKVFTRPFWDRAGLSFPERVRYEDQPALTRAFVEADRFDVLGDTVYLWRVRSDGSSISQRRHEVADLDDRMRTKRWSTDLVLDRTSPQTQRVWFGRVLPVDMWEYFRSVPGCSQEYWERLREGLLDLWNEQTLPFERTEVPLRQRVMGWLVAQDRRADLEHYLAGLDEGSGPGSHPFAGEPGLPPELNSR